MITSASVLRRLATFALAWVAFSLMPAPAFAKFGNMFISESTKVNLKGSGGDNYRVEFDQNVKERGLLAAFLNVRRTINGKEELSVVSGELGRFVGDVKALVFDAKNFTFSDGVKQFLLDDAVEFKIFLRGKNPVRVTRAGVFKHQIASDELLQAVKVPGGAFQIDPGFSIFDDLDILSGSDSPMTIKNLAFMSDLTESQFSLLDPANLPGEPVTSSFNLSSSQAMSPLYPVLEDFPGVLSEPELQNFDIAQGLVFDPDSGDTSRFLYAIQAVPEPGSASMVVAGIAVLGAFLFVSRGRKKAPRSGRTL